MSVCNKTPRKNVQLVNRPSKNTTHGQIVMSGRELQVIIIYINNEGGSFIEETPQ